MPIYMKYEGIKGGVATGKYAGWIELNSCQFSANRGIDAPRGTSREAATPSVSEIVITKHEDISSPHLFREAVSGTGKKVVIDFVKEEKDVVNVYLSFELEKVFLSSYSTSGGGNNGKTIENITLNFTKITFSSQPKDPPAKPSPSQTKATWDLGTTQSP